MRRKIVLDRPDGKEDQFENIQNALNGGNVLLILPEGIYPVSRTLKVFSHTTIRAAENTVIRRMDHTAVTIADCLIRNEPDSECIELDGGIWDMNNAANPRGTDKEKSYWGLALRFEKIRDLTLRDLTVANAETYFIRLNRIDGFRILNVKLFTSHPAPNQDGVHMNGYCFNGVIRGLHAISTHTPDDDMIAFNAFDPSGWQNDGIVTGPIENIEVEDVYAENAYGFFRMLTKEPGEYIRNIRIRNCRGGVRYLFLNANSFADAKPGMGRIENVEFSGICVHKMPLDLSIQSYAPHSVWGMQLHMDNVVIRDYERPLLDTGSAPTMNLHPQCGEIQEFVPESQPVSFDTNEAGETVLKSGGFRLLKIGQKR